MNNLMNDLRPGLTWAGGLILLALGATAAKQLGYIDQDAVLRIVIGTNGLMIAYFGNRAPKAVAPSACARQVTRFAGWSMVISGLAYAGLWAFAPIDTAIMFGTGIVAAGMIATFAYCWRLRARSRNAPLTRS